MQEDPRKFSHIDLEALSTHPELQKYLREHPLVGDDEPGLYSSKKYLKREEMLEYSY